MIISVLIRIVNKGTYDLKNTRKTCVQIKEKRTVIHNKQNKNKQQLSSFIFVTCEWHSGHLMSAYLSLLQNVCTIETGTSSSWCCCTSQVSANCSRRRERHIASNIIHMYSWCCQYTAVFLLFISILIIKTVNYARVKSGWTVALKNIN